MPIRTTEQSAPATLAELIPQLTMLTTDQPTTAEIEEALIKIVPAITRTLGDWIRSRHTISTNAHLAAQFDETHPAVSALVMGPKGIAAAQAYAIPAVHPEVAAQMAALDQPAPLTEEDIASPELDEEFDRIERAHPEPGFHLDLRDLA